MNSNTTNTQTAVDKELATDSKSEFPTLGRQRLGQLLEDALGQHHAGPLSVSNRPLHISNIKRSKYINSTCPPRSQSFESPAQTNYVWGMLHNSMNWMYTNKCKRSTNQTNRLPCGLLHEQTGQKFRPTLFPLRKQKTKVCRLEHLWTFENMWYVNGARPVLAAVETLCKQILTSLPGSIGPWLAQAVFLTSEPVQLQSLQIPRQPGQR